MKKFVIIISFLLLAPLTYGQSYQEEIDLFQVAFGMDKREVVAGFVQTEPEEEEAFWKLYDEYEAKRKELGKERIDLLMQYADQYEDMSGADADAMTRKIIALKTKTDKLITSYYNKIRNATDGIVATQFFQIESFILAEVRAKILETIPFVEWD